MSGHKFHTAYYEVTAPPDILVLLQETLYQPLTDSEKAQSILIDHRLDGMETCDDPYQQAIIRPFLYEVIIRLLSRGASYQRCVDWLHGSIRQRTVVRKDRSFVTTY